MVKRMLHISQSQPDGTVIDKKRWRCEGTFGTCTMNISVGSGESAASINSSLDPIEIGGTDSPIFYTNVEILTTEDSGVLFAINKSEYTEECEQFFGDGDIKTISGEVKVDNPEFLEQLSLTDEISLQGEYEVYETETHKYIVIDE